VKTKFKITIRAAGCSFGEVVCVGAVLLIVSTAHAQNLFVSSAATIYEFTPGGVSSVFASIDGSSGGEGLAFNREGDLFVPNANLGTITEIAPNGTQSIFASGLQTPDTLAFDSVGDLFVSDTGTSAIYKYTPDGVRSTFATGLYAPYGLAFNSTGNLFVAANSVIYQFSPNGVGSVFASVPEQGLGGLAFNSAGDLFVTAGGTTGYIYEFMPNGMQSTFASGLNEPLNLAFNSTGDLFVSNFGASPWIYKFTPDGIQSAFDSSGGAIGLAFQGETLPVPEPSVLVLLAVGATILLVRRPSIAGLIIRRCQCGLRFRFRIRG
jgi:hypothetical protein